MRKLVLCVCALLVSALVPSIGFADVVLAYPTPALPAPYWVSWAAGTPISGSYFWNNTSTDGVSPHYCNVGYILDGSANSNSSSCGGSLPLTGYPGTPAFFAADSTGTTAVTDTVFQDSALLQNMAIRVEISAYAGTDALYIYPANANGTSAGAGQLVGSTIGTHNVTLPGGTTYFGFYLVSGNGATYYTDSNLNSSDTGNQHFAVFQQGSTYWVGVEDLPVGTTNQGDRDYNDMIFTVSDAVPEPASILLFGVCTLCLGRSLLRRRA